MEWVEERIGRMKANFIPNEDRTLGELPHGEYFRFSDHGGITFGVYTVFRKLRHQILDSCDDICKEINHCENKLLVCRVDSGELYLLSGSRRVVVLVTNDQADFYEKK